jgi:hypothetical protein
MNELETIFDELIQDLKDGSVELLEYIAQQQRLIAEAFAGDSPNKSDILKDRLLAIKGYAATEAIRKADKIDAAIWSGIIKGLDAFASVAIAAAAKI